MFYLYFYLFYLIYHGFYLKNHLFYLEFYLFILSMTFPRIVCMPSLSRLEYDSSVTQHFLHEMRLLVEIVLANNIYIRS